MTIKRQDYLVRAGAVALCLALGYVSLAVHIYRLQVLRHEELYKKARDKYTSRRTERARRGRIFDVEGNLLAASITCKDVLAEPWRFRGQEERVATLLCHYVGVNPATLKERFQHACGPKERFPDIVLENPVSPERVKEIKSRELKGISFREPDRPEGQQTGLLAKLHREFLQNNSGPKLVTISSRCYRTGKNRELLARVLAEIIPELIPEDLVSRFTETDRNSGRPVEVVVKRRVGIDDIERLKCLRDVVAGPRLVNEELDHVTAILSRELDIPAPLLAARLAHTTDETSGKKVVALKRWIPGPVAERIAHYSFSGLDLVPSLPDGIRFAPSTRRFYPKDSLLAPVLGFLGPSGHGAGGLEAHLDRLLVPTEGESYYERDRKGYQILPENIKNRPALDGADVYLTIREPIQQIMEDELERLVEEFTPRAAYAVMANPVTGAIMGLAQYPTFNPNDRSTMKNPDHWRNRILTEGFEPGSVMKCITLAGALDFDVVSPYDVFDCENGLWYFSGRPLRDSGHSFGDLSVREIIQKSSNIGITKIAIKMEPPKLYQTLLRFGFGKKTGIDIGHEASGIFRRLDQWDGLSISRFAIGQGILVTPLQLVQAYCALANGGVMMQLRILDHVTSQQSEQSYTCPPAVKRRTVRPAAAYMTVQAMKLVTQPEGTAQKAAVEGYETAGKTGTAQKWINPSDGVPGHYSHTRYIASFIGFAPADNPAFVLLVSADEPQKSHYGGTVAAPVFSRIADRTLRYLQVAPSETLIADSDSAPAAMFDEQ